MPSHNATLEAARAGIEQIVLRSRKNDDPVVRALVASTVNGEEVPEGIRLVLGTMGPDAYANVMRATTPGVVTGFWERAKVVYATDADLMQYLTDRDVAVPAGILRTLPHPDPYVLLPLPDQDTGPGQEIGVPYGAFIFGRYGDGNHPCSTADPRMTDLGVMFTIRLPGQPGRLFTLRCIIPLPAGPTAVATVGEVVSKTIARFHYSPGMSGITTDQRQKLQPWLEAYIPQVFGTLMYVCTDQPDTSVWTRPQAPPRRKNAGRRPGRRARLDHPADPDTIVSLGFRLGPALREAQERHEQAYRGGSREPQSAGWKQPPHQRRPHLQTFWTGAGRTVPRLRFVNSYWVGLDQLAEPPATAVVRPVRRPAGHEPAAQDR